MNPKKILVFAEKYGLFVLVGVTAIAFVLACLETYSADDERGAIYSAWIAVSNTITSESHDSEGWTRIMHVLLTAVLGWAATRVYMSSAGFKWDTFAARYLVRNHVVIIAGRTQSNPDQKGVKSPNVSVETADDKSALAIDLAQALSSNYRVVLYLPELDSANATRLWDSGVTVVCNDTDMPSALAATGVARAHMLFAMRDSHAENIILTRAAVAPSMSNPNLRCNCMIDPVSAKREFRLEDYLESDTLARVRIFNEAEMVARSMLREYPPDKRIATTDQRVHLLLVGLGSVGQSILLQLARMGHYRSGLRPKVTVVDRQVNLRLEQLQRTHPALRDWIDIETEESRIEGIGEAEIEHWSTDQHPITMVYVCIRNEIVNLRIARLLLHRFSLQQAAGGPPAPPVVALDPAGGCVLSEFASHGNYNGRFFLFSLIRDPQNSGPSPVTDSLVADLDDARARLLHDDYRAKNPGLPASVPWEQLPETYRDANRSSADHVDVKLRAVGRLLVPAREGGGDELSDDEIEILARIEHDRWWADRALDGWRYGPDRVNARKLHPNMVPYNDLSENDKKKDRDNVRQILAVVCSDDHCLIKGELSQVAH